MTVAALERSRELLGEGRPRRALKALPGRIPAAFRFERDFLEGEAWRQQGFFRAAQRLYLRVRTRTVLKQDPALWLEAGLALAACGRSLGAVAQARKYLSGVRRVARARRWETFLSRARLEAALADRAAGLYSKSLAELSSIFKKHLKAREWADCAFVSWAMGGALRFQGGLEASESMFRRSLRLARRAGDDSGQAYALFGLGGVTRVMGRLRDSARYYSLAGRKLARSEDLFGRAYAECGLANALRQSGRLGDAGRHYRRAHRLYSRLEDDVDLAYVEWGLGKAHLGRGELGPAIRRLRRSLDIFRRRSEARGEALAGIALAHAFHAAGKTRGAEALFERSYLLSRRSGLHAHLEIFT